MSLAIETEASTDFYVKPIIRLLSDRPVLLPDQIQLAGQMRMRYGCTYGDALNCMVPSAVAAVGDKMVRMVELSDPAEAAQRLADGEIDRVGHQRVIEMLLEYGAVPVQEILHGCQISRAVLKTLEKKELVNFYRQEIRRSGGEEPEYELVDDFQPTGGPGVKRSARSAPPLNQPATTRIWPNLSCSASPAAARPKSTCRRARIATDLGRGVIILVPEISLTPQMISRIRSRFGTGVAVLHSRLTPSERYEQWQRILRQEVLVVVGARSAIFAPLAGSSA